MLPDVGFQRLITLRGSDHAKERLYRVLTRHGESVSICHRLAEGRAALTTSEAVGQQWFEIWMDAHVLPAVVAGPASP